MAKILSYEETKKSLIAWRIDGDENALTELVVRNQGLVNCIAQKYFGKGLTMDEMKSAGNIGLLNAINKFDYENRPIQGFSTYISLAIENQIKMEFRKYNKHSHVLSFNQPIANSKDGDELKLEDIIGSDPDELLENVISQMKIEIVRDSLNCLTSREKQIILLRYGLDEVHRKTQEEVAQIFGCSRSLINRQESKALIKMRHPRNTRKLKDLLDD